MTMRMGPSAWGHGNEQGRIYCLSAEDTQRVGCCWMDGRLRAGDIALCVEHSGDAFYDYILLQVGRNFVKGIPESSFGSYCFGGDALSWYPTNKEFHLLCAGESLSVPVGDQHPLATALAARRQAPEK